VNAAIVSEGTRYPFSPFQANPLMFDADNAPRFRHLRRINGLLWDRVAEYSTAFKEERNA
jgi:hypothetical protein